MDGVVYAPRLQPTTAATQGTNPSSCPCDVPDGLEGSNQDGTGSPRFIPQASMFGHMLCLPRDASAQRAIDHCFVDTCHDIPRPTAYDTTVSAKCRPATERTAATVLADVIALGALDREQTAGPHTSQYDENTAT